MTDSAHPTHEQGIKEKTIVASHCYSFIYLLDIKCHVHINEKLNLNIHEKIRKIDYAKSVKKTFQLPMLLFALTFQFEQVIVNY